VNSTALLADTPTRLTLDMTSPRSDEPSRSDGSSATREAWLQAVRGVILRSRPDASDEEFDEAFARQLVSTTEDGLQIQPLFDSSQAIEVGVPGFAPYVRSTHVAPTPWEVRQRVWPTVDGSSAIGELESGATGVLLELGTDIDAAGLRRILDGVFLELAPISLATPVGDDGTAAAALLVDAWDAASIAPDQRRGTLGVDPIGAWARSGGWTDVDAGWERTATMVAALADTAPNAKVVVADGTVWHEPGATDTQELGWNIAAACHAVRALTAAGVPVERAFAQLEFRWAATADQFETIAKFRAARRLWSRVAEIAGLAPEARGSFHHADTSKVMMTRYDPWVNALRSTVACFAAGLGGADAVTVLPHDGLITVGGTSLGRRIARNTQTVLQMESNLTRVIDPAGGSWYVEQLTDQLATAAWAELQRIERAGGIVAAVTAGQVHELLAAARATRDRRIASRKQPLTGLTEFPDILETPPPPEPPPTTHPETVFAPLRLERASASFERQRARSDRATEQTGTRPAVFLATLGTPAQFTARATFAKNLFEAVGIRTIAGAPDEFAGSGATVACLCSSDPVYGELADAAVAELRSAGVERILVAGRKLNLAGVDEEVGAGSDILDVLTRTLDVMQVARHEVARSEVNQ
jgi:methylmalonyl-CoA mutase